MRELNNWWNKQREPEKLTALVKNVVNAEQAVDLIAETVWRGALEWYQLTAAECEKDCHTNEDYRTLYCHLKQVLENELKSE